MEIENKQVLYIPCLFDCPLSLGHRLVLAYMDYQSRYGCEPSDVAIHYNTGLSRATISKVRVELVRDGWLEDGLTEKTKSYTRPANNEWGYQYFPYYIRTPGSPLSFAAVAIWSMIRSKLGVKTSKDRLCYEYFRSALGLGNGTAQNCFKALKEAGWLDFIEQNRGNLSIKLYKLRPEQLACLRDKKEKEEQEWDIRECEEYAPASEVKLLPATCDNGIIPIPQEEKPYEPTTEDYLLYLYQQIGHRTNGRDWARFKSTITKCPPRASWEMEAADYKRLLQAGASLCNLEKRGDSDAVRSESRLMAI